MSVEIVKKQQIDQTFTIGGGTPIFSDDFETGDLSHTEGGFSWGATSGDVTVSNVNPIDGTYSLRFSWPGGSIAEIRYNLGDDYSEVWIRYRLRIPSDYFHTNITVDNNKFLRLWEGTGSTSANLKVGFSLRGTGSDGESVITTEWRTTGSMNEWDYSTSPLISTGDFGNVIEVVTRCKTDSGAGDAAMQVWKNGSLISSITDLSNYQSDPLLNVFTSGYTLGAATSTLTNPTVFHLDGFKFNDSDIWSLS